MGNNLTNFVGNIPSINNLFIRQIKGYSRVLKQTFVEIDLVLHKKL